MKFNGICIDRIFYNGQEIINAYSDGDHIYCALPARSQAVHFSELSVDIDTEVNQCYTNYEEATTEEQTRQSVYSKYVDGNASLFGEVYDVNGIEFTDADLPTNYEINWVGIYNDTGAAQGLYGFGFLVNERDYAYTSTSIIQVRVSDAQLNIPHTFSLGDKINLKVNVTETQFTAELNGSSFGPISYTEAISGETLELLTRGGGNGKSTHDCYSFKITNTDTDEIIMNFQSFEETIDQLDNNQARHTDATGKYEILWSNTYDGWLVDSAKVATNDVEDTGALCDKVGLTVAIRNEVGNYDFGNGTDGWVSNASSGSVANGIFSNQGSGTASQPNAIYSCDDTLSISDRIFGFGKIRATNSDCTRLRIRLDGSSGGTQVTPAFQLNPVQNQWYELFGFMDVTDQTGGTAIRFVHDYVDDATASGKTMEIDGNISNGGGVFALNLSAIDRAKGTSYAQMTASEINDIKYDLLAMQIYRDPNATVLYETGQPVSALQNDDGSFSDTVCKGYDENGDNADLEYSGEIKPLFHSVTGAFRANGTNNYIDTGIVPNQNTIFRFWGKFTNIPITDIMGSRNSVDDSEYMMGSSTTSWGIWVNDTTYTGGTSDEELHKFEWNDGELFVDNAFIAGSKGKSVGTPTQSIYLLAYSDGGADTLNNDIDLYKAEIYHNSQTHIWLFDADNEEVIYTIDGVLQATPTIGGTVQSSQWIDETIEYVDDVYPNYAPKDINETFYENVTDDIPSIKVVEGGVVENIYNGVTVSEDGNEICISSDYTIDGLEDGKLIDQSTDGDERDSVMSRKIVGNDSLLGEVYTVDGLEFTDAQLFDIDNFKIIYKGTYEDTANFKGFFGIDASGTDNFYFRSNDTEGSFSFNAKGAGLTALTSLTYGNDIEVVITFTPTTFNLVINGDDYGTVAYTLILANKPFQLLSAGDSSQVSSHTLFSFKITNTDTDEVIMNFQSFEETIDAQDNNQARTVDATGEYEILWSNTYYTSETDAWIVDSVLQATNDETTTSALSDKLGNTIAKATGKNLITLWEQGTIQTDGTLSGSSTTIRSIPLLIDGIDVLSFSGTQRSFHGLYFYEKDMTFISREAGSTMPRQNKTVPENAYWVRCLVQDSSTLTPEAYDYQLEEGAVATDYEAWTGYYRDPNATIPYLDGQSLAPVQSADESFSTSLCKAYLPQERQSVLNKALNGNASRYVNVPSFTDTDLPTNCDIEWVGSVEEITNQRGLFGFDSAGSDRFYIQTNGNANQFRLGYYDRNVGVSYVFSLGETLTIVYEIRDDELTLKINGDIVDNGTVTILRSGNSLQSLTSGAGSGISINKCHSLRITNTDTGEDLVKYNFQDNYEYVYDQSGNDNHGEIISFVGDGTDRVEVFGDSDMNDNGYTEARAQGNQRFNLGLSIDGRRLDENDGDDISQPISTVSVFHVIDDLENIYASGVDLSQLRICTYDENQAFIAGFRSIQSVSVIGAKWFRVSVLTADKATLMVNSGTSALPLEAWDGYYREIEDANEVIDPNFVGGLGTWSVVGSNVTNLQVVDQEFSFEHLASTFGVVQQDTNIEVETNDKIFMFVRAKSTEDTTDFQIYIRNGASTPTTDVEGPTTSTYSDIYNIATVTSGGIGDIALRYEGSQSIGTVLTVEGDSSKGGGLYAINLTRIDNAYGTSYASMTAEEINSIKDTLAQLQLGIDPVSDGDLAPVIPDGNSVWYLGDGTRASSQYSGEYEALHADLDNKGRIPEDLRVVNGLIDLVTAERTDLFQMESFYDESIDELSITMDVSNQNFKYTSIPYSLKPSTQYMLNVDMEIVSGDSRVTVRDSGGSGLPGAARDDSGRVLFTTDATGNGFIYFYCALTSNVSSYEVNYTNFRVYLASQFDAPLTDDLPKDDQPVLENSVVVSDKYPLFAYSDKINLLKESGSFTSNITNNYLDTEIVPNQDTVTKIWGRFNVTSNQRMGSRNGLTDAEYRLEVASGDLRLVWGNVAYSGITADTDLHEFEINNGVLYVDGISVSGSEGASLGTPTNAIALFTQRTSSSGFQGYCDFTMYRAEIIHNGEVHVWDFNANDDETVKYTIDGILQVSPTLQGDVTSGQWGNEGAEFKVEGLSYWYEFTDSPETVKYRVISIADLDTINEQIFVVKDEDGALIKLGVYSSDTSNWPCNPAIVDFFNVHELFFVLNDASTDHELFEVDGLAFSVKG